MRSPRVIHGFHIELVVFATIASGAFVFSQEAPSRKSFPYAASNIVFSPDGKRMAVGGGFHHEPRRSEQWTGAGYVRVFETKDFQETHFFSEPSAKDSAVVNFATNDELISWNQDFVLGVNGNPANGIERRVIDLTGHKEESVGRWRVTRAGGGFAYDPVTQKSLIAEGGLQLYFGEDLQAAAPFDMSSTVGTVGFSRDRKSFVIVPTSFAAQPSTEKPDPTIFLFDTQSLELRSKFTPGDVYMWVFTFSPDDSLLAFQTFDKKGLLVVQGDLSGQIANLKFEQKCGGFAFSPDNKTLAVATSREAITLYAIPSGEKIRAFEGQKEGVTSFAFSPNGSLLAVGCGNTNDKGRNLTTPKVYIWDPKTGKQLKVLE